MNKINEYFDKDEYVVFFGHDMPQVGYSYVEDYDEEVGRDLFVALFKLFVLSKENDSGEFYNTFEGVNFCFDDDFGNYDENEGYDDFVESLEKKDADLTKEEFDLLKEYLTNLIEDVVSFEADEYDSDFADSDIEDAIQNKRFVIVISTNSLL